MIGAFPKDFVIVEYMLNALYFNAHFLGQRKLFELGYVSGAFVDAGHQIFGSIKDLRPFVLGANIGHLGEGCLGGLHFDGRLERI